MNKNDSIDFFVKLVQAPRQRLLQIIDCGVYNDVIKGYLVYAMQKEGFSNTDISKLLLSVHFMLDTYNAYEAESKYRGFIKNELSNQKK